MSRAASNLTFPRWCTLDEYFKLAEESEKKLEYYGSRSSDSFGEVVAMAGGSEKHGLIVVNITSGIHTRLLGTDCRFYPADFRVSAKHFRSYNYADGHVIYGPTLFDDRDNSRQTALNPKVIVEVLSPSTEQDDRGRKFARYIQISSLEDYVLVSQHEPRVEVISRHTNGTWLISPFIGLDASAKLPSLGIELPLAEIFLNVNFPPEPPEDVGIVVLKDPG